MQISYTSLKVQMYCFHPVLRGFYRWRQGYGLGAEGEGEGEDVWISAAIASVAQTAVLRLWKTASSMSFDMPYVGNASFGRLGGVVMILKQDFIL